jgi:glycosyltransferase involved in cell wall biosynthesis
VTRDDRSAPFGGAPVVFFGCFGRHDWGLLRQREHAVVDWLAGTGPLAYIERHGSRALGPAKVVRALAKRFGPSVNADAIASAAERAAPRFSFVRFPVVPLHNVRPVDRLNGGLALWSVSRLPEFASIGECVAFVTYPSPYAAEALRIGKFRFVVYDASHRFAEAPGTYGPRVGDIDASLARGADFVSVDTHALLKDRRQCGIESYLMPQGVDRTFLDDSGPGHSVRECIDRLKRSGPVAGFVGGIGELVDFGMVSEVAAALGEVSFVLVGPIMDVEIPPMPRNVHVLGPVAAEAVPTVVQGLDVGLIPYPRSRRTDAVLPTKLLEYLAGGCRVVSTALPEVVEHSDALRGAVMTSDSPGKWASHIREAISLGRLDRTERATVFDRYGWPSLLRTYGEAVRERFDASA